MVLLVCGINYKKANLSIRERCSVSNDSLITMLTALDAEPAIQEAMILSTCNRTELILVANPSWPALTWMAHYFCIDPKDFPGYIFQDQSAIMHLMEVACGLDSMVLGETQILGQMKNAFDMACNQNTIGSELHQLLPYIFHVGKNIRNQTDICKHAGTLPAVIRQLIQESYPFSTTPSILFIGASEMNTQIAKSLLTYHWTPAYWINRTFEKAQQRALDLGGTALAWEELEEIIPKVDIIITATASTNPILTTAHFTQTKKIICIDLAIPRDTHEDVKKHAFIDLYYLDDLHSRLQAGQSFRQNAASEAQKLIHSYVENFTASQIQQEHSALIFQYRTQAEQLREQALQHALSQLSKGMPAEEVCAQLSKQLTSRLLHHPTIGLRDMIARSDDKTLACLAARLEKQA